MIVTESFAMTKVLLLCECSLCECSVEESRSIRAGGQHFCSETYARGHPNMELCDDERDYCHCGIGDLELLLGLLISSETA